MKSIAQEPISPQDYQRFADRVHQALAPDLWQRLATQRWCDSPNTVGRRLIGAGYRALYGWAITPAAFPHLHDDGTVGCSCWQGAKCPTPGKHPLGAHGVETHPTAPTLAWLVEALLEPGSCVGYDAGYDGNLAALTGQRSDSLMVADIDPRHQGRLEALFAAGWPSATTIERTGGGGWHVFARWPFAGPVPTISSYLPGIELKGDGALVIVSPSRHASGQHYAWLQGHAPWQRAMTTLPMEVATAIAQRPEASHAPAAHPNTYGHAGFAVGLTYTETCAFAARRYLRALEKAIGEGEGRNNTAYWLARQLQALGLSEGDVTAWVLHFGRQVSDK